MVKLRILTESPAFIQKVKNASNREEADNLLKEVRGLALFRLVFFGVSFVFFGYLISTDIFQFPSYLTQYGLRGFLEFFYDYQVATLFFVLVAFSFYKIASAVVLLFNYLQMKKIAETKG
jgi:hypothetical protein